MEVAPIIRSYRDPKDCQIYNLRGKDNKLELYQVTNDGEKLVADKTYLDDNSIMRRGYGYDNTGRTIVKRHSIIPKQPEPIHVGNFYLKFQVRDLGYNGEGFSSGFKFKVIGDMNCENSITSLVTWGRDKSTVATLDEWNNIGPLARRFVVKLLEYTKV